MGTLEIVGALIFLAGLAPYLVDVDFDMDVDVPALGAFDVIGFAACCCLIAGLLLMLEDWRWAMGISLVVVAVTAARATVRYRATRSADHPGPAEQLVGQEGYTKTGLEPRGLVQLRGETWSAESDDGRRIDQGARVLVLEVEGNTLTVFKVEAPGPGY